MEHKPKRRTRERILEAALALFNDAGDAAVTTAAIAEAVGISPGNLYYHFRSKDRIVGALFAAFRRDIEAALVVPAGRLAHAEDAWFFLHLLFETIWKYRFLYRDLNDVLSRHAAIAGPFRRIIAQKTRTASQILHGLVDSGAMQATTAEIEMLATTMTLVASTWLSFARVRDGATTSDRDGAPLARGACTVISLAAPYLAPAERALFDRLAARYLS